ncbi:hypothetical protein ColLi_06404 [Colletotrichum liriopes]|uniref:Uncharacterized protein n=1 Tax=Colletotrichum liriopes TaxID=708192 RepID=A0AA37GM48_9PEZI|nr:hypothetical protein ColLi_06404 [Colletotrichum liriopes]
MMLGMAMHSCVKNRLMQVPDFQGSHSVFNGMHCIDAAMTQANVQRDVKLPQIQAPFRTSRIGKMRR